jgi:hypothetical protein
MSSHSFWTAATCRHFQSADMSAHSTSSTALVPLWRDSRRLRHRGRAVPGMEPGVVVLRTRPRATIGNPFRILSQRLRRCHSVNSVQNSAFSVLFVAKIPNPRQGLPRSTSATQNPQAFARLRKPAQSYASHSPRRGYGHICATYSDLFRPNPAYSGPPSPHPYERYFHSVCS